MPTSYFVDTYVRLQVGGAFFLGRKTALCKADMRPFLPVRFVFGSYFPLLGHLTRFLSPKRGKSPPHVLDTLHHPTERSLASFSDSLGSEISRAASGQKYEEKI